MPDDVTSAPVAAPAGDTAAPAPALNPASDTPTPEVTPPGIEDAFAAFESMSAAEREAFLSGEKPTPTEPAPKPKVEEPAKPEQPKEKVEDEHERIPGRIGLGGIKEETKAKMVQLTKLMKAGVDEADAIKQVFGTPKPTEAPTESDQLADKAPEAPQAPEVPESIKSIEDAIAAKKAEIARVKSEYGDTTDLIEQLADLKLDLRDAKREHELASASQATFQAEVKTSLNKVMSDYSDLWTDVKPGQTKSAFESYCDDEFLLANAKSDPVLQRPDWPEQIAKRVKEKFFEGLSVLHNADREGDEPTIPPLPKQSVRLPGSLTGTTDAPGVLTPATIMAQFDSLSEEQRMAVLNGKP